MTSLPYSRERALAEAAVLRAALLTKKVQSGVKAGSVTKDDMSPVTVADFAAQALLIAALSKAFPSDQFVGEEDASELRDASPGGRFVSEEDAAEKRKKRELVSWICELVRTAPTVSDPQTGSDLYTPTSDDEILGLIDRGGQGKGGRSGRFWVMDPVDGTKTFLNQQQYAVSLSLIENGREVVGVLCCPNLRLTDGRVYEDSVDPTGLGVMLTAVRGQGATVRTLSASKDTTPYVLPEPKPLEHLSPPSNMNDLHIVDSPKSTAIRHDVVRHLAHHFGVKYPGTEVWSSHMRYASLILGGADCQIRVPVQEAKSKVCIWDHAGAQLIFTEAGGKITDLDKKEMDFGAGREMSNNRGMMVARDSVDGVHQQLLNLVKKFIES